jgi:hypothetical protein
MVARLFLNQGSGPGIVPPGLIVVMLPHHHNQPLQFLKTFKFSDFNKEPPSSLKII